MPQSGPPSQREGVRGREKSDSSGITPILSPFPYFLIRRVPWAMLERIVETMLSKSKSVPAWV
jgi:hypothetical protein